MPAWNKTYYEDLASRHAKMMAGLEARLDDVIAGRVAPALEDIPIGSARKLNAAILFFDIRDFSSWSGDPSDASLKRALIMLDCVIPMMMHVLHDHGAYVEKNTGDGVMAVFADSPDAVTSINSALDASTTMFYMLHVIVNTSLANLGMPPVNARIGVDHGSVLIGRIGVATGGARLGRNALVAIGPAANLACRLQGMAGTNEIWVGNGIWLGAAAWRKQFFRAATPPNWTWTHVDRRLGPYWVWKYVAEKVNPYAMPA